MLPVTTRLSSSAFRTRLCSAGVTTRRGQATLSTEQQPLSAAQNTTLGWSKTRPFECAPWKKPNGTKGTIRFLGATKDGKPAFLNFKKGQEHETNFGPSLERVVDITDMRDFEPRTTLGVEGVEWVYAPTTLSEDKLLAPDKNDVEAFVRGPYFGECARLVEERTGAVKAVPYNFRHRRIELTTNLHDPYNFSSKPLPNFHMDNDAETAKVNLRRVLGEEEAARWLNKRWGIVNVWRPVGDVVRQWPLALVDSRTIVYGRDTQPIYTLNNYKTHFTALRPQSHFNFYYVSNLAPDEALLFVDYDSAHEGRDSPVGMAHGAFQDHFAPEKIPRRRSIEVRCLVLYKD
ncbi:hypothetical protein NOR_07507 [Metarhizium rileyi]|uniref:Methyltransferase n=1 Tax=Metarhizium rileyi (strain RCEF 4871) TaxID=1649241 RepID=A0A166Y1L9_METRR|nr:hypothetical protein NOR_07507 [Metarhizium rileyi RCEF 4871]